VPRIHFELETELTPKAVLGALTDFSEHRAEVWPNIDKDHFRVHGQGAGWAEVTEGNALAGGIWERNRYEWSETPDRLLITTLESNTWKPGSRWEYRLTPTAFQGTKIDVQVVRNGYGIKGTLLGWGIGLFGERILRNDMAKVLAERRGAR
jgi:hypothetical protein